MKLFDALFDDAYVTFDDCLWFKIWVCGKQIATLSPESSDEARQEFENSLHETEIETDWVDNSLIGTTIMLNDGSWLSYEYDGYDVQCRRHKTASFNDNVKTYIDRKIEAEAARRKAEAAKRREGRWMLLDEDGKVLFTGSRLECRHMSRDYVNRDLTMVSEYDV